jgi:outer membrane protein OmpA-like peptidoglycan-associated protein
MKKIYCTIALMFLIVGSFAQNKFTEKADKLFESYQYVDAIDEYLKLAESKNVNQYVFEQLADCYFTIFNTEKAIVWYEKAVQGKAKPETYFRYAQTLKSFGKYKEANAQMDIFASMVPNDVRAKEHKLNPNYIPSLVNKSKMFDVSETNFKNMGQSDFGPVLNNDNTLYFVSTRNTSNKTDKWNDQPYLDIFKSFRNDDGTLTEPTPVKELNTPFHDGPVTFSTDGNTLFFARDGLSEGQYEKTKNNKFKVGQQGLYKATKVEGKWSQVEALPFNSITYSVTCPSLSKDGKTLCFSSNMPGGLGESDIWKVTIETNGYGKPENLGARINSADKENFPFITEDNVLYFASTGKQGFGGFDIYKINLASTEQAQNIGTPVNSEKDDFSFSFNKSLNVGYFSSNRNGMDAIFNVKPICTANAIVTVINKKTGLAIPNALVTILDAKGNIISTLPSKADGKVNYDIECETEYNIQAKAQNFETASVTLQKIKSGQTIIQVQLVPEEVIITETEVILKNVYFDFNKSNITSQGANELDKLVKVMRDYPNMVIFVKSHTDSKGSAAYNLKLSEQRAQATVQYLISKNIDSGRITGKGFGSSEQKIQCGANCTEEEHAQNRRSEFVIVKK